MDTSAERRVARIRTTVVAVGVAASLATGGALALTALGQNTAVARSGTSSSNSGSASSSLGSGNLRAGSTTTTHATSSGS